jgi:hypothetical protein
LQPKDDFAGVLPPIRSASALIEATFLAAGRTLEASIEILAKMTSGSEAVLESLQGEKLDEALKALSRTAARIDALGQNQGNESARFDGMRGLTTLIAQRVAQMKASLKYVDSLAMNARIAAADLIASKVDFTSFADEIARTVNVTKRTLDSFTAELQVVHQRVAAAHVGRIQFATIQHEAAGSITRRLLTTVKSIESQHQRAARSHRDVRSSGDRIRQRICEAILALQIGDITRQRLEHAEFALGLVGEARPTLHGDDQQMFATIARQLQSAQLADAAGDFDRDVRRIAGSLNSLASEAQGLRGLADATHGSADRDGGSFMMDLESEVGEALTLLEGFEAARAEVAAVTASVSEATVRLCAHLRNVQSLEADIRIMGLNTTFKCARVGRDGLALSLIAQELRTYATAFSKEAGGLMGEVEKVAAISDSLVGGMPSEQAPVMDEAARPMRHSHTTLREMRRILDAAMAGLTHDGERVVTALTDAVADLEKHGKTGETLREAAAKLTALTPGGRPSTADLPPPVEQLLEIMARGYTMANERAVHDRYLGRVSIAAAAPAMATELEDLLF